MKHLNTHVSMANANILTYDRIYKQANVGRPNKQIQCDVQEKEKPSVYAKLYIHIKRK